MRNIPQNTGGEEWRAVVGFEGFYEVSSLGRVRSLDRKTRTCYGATRQHRGRVMTPVVDRDGYPRVILRINGKHRTRPVHRLVADAFHGDKKNVLHRQVDHIDRNRSNAAASNLRWFRLGKTWHAATRPITPGAKRPEGRN